MAHGITGWRLGFALGSERHSREIDAMRQWLEHEVVEVLAEWAEGHVALPEAPAEWWGEKRHVGEDVAAIAAAVPGATLLHSSTGLLCDAHTIVQVDCSSGVEEALARLSDGLEGRGFTVWRRSAPGAYPIIEATRTTPEENTRVYISPARFPMRSYPMAFDVASLAAAPQDPPPRTCFVVDLFHGFSDDRLAELATQAVERDLSPLLGLVLADQLSHDLRGRLLERCVDLGSPKALLSAAKLARDADRSDLAIELVTAGLEHARERDLRTDELERLAEALGR